MFIFYNEGKTSKKKGCPLYMGMVLPEPLSLHLGHSEERERDGLDSPQ